MWVDYSKRDVPYWVSKAGCDRFAIVSKHKRFLLGYVFSNGNGTWYVERTGKRLGQVYASIDEAAKALIAFASMARATH